MRLGRMKAGEAAMADADDRWRVLAVLTYLNG